jgi:hypothetical protein
VVLANCSVVPARHRWRCPGWARRSRAPGARPRAERQAGVPGRPGTAANATGPRAASGGAP